MELTAIGQGSKTKTGKLKLPDSIFYSTFFCHLFGNQDRQEKVENNE